MQEEDASVEGSATAYCQGFTHRAGNVHSAPAETNAAQESNYR